MKKLPYLLALLALPLLRADQEKVIPEAPAETAVPPASKSPADTDFDAIGAIVRQGPANPKLYEENRREFVLWQNHQHQFLAEAARAFAAKYPHDPRRYEGLVQSSYLRPWFVTGFKPEFDAAPREENMIVDRAALEEFLSTQATFLKEVILATDASTRQRGGAMFALLADARGLARDHGQSLNLAPFTALTEQVITTLPDERALPVVEQYLAALKALSPEAVQAFEDKIQSAPTLARAVADAKAKQEAVAAEKAKKIADLGSLKFTAADGREVELSKLKGKVVLIDFWATWCGPCVAELPNVIANYKKYHDKGFEIVGISLENPGSKPTDTAEQAAARLATSKAKMIAFTVKNEMPWPQYFDGKWWKNDYAQKFGIEAIPAMFLLDQQGNIVSTEARGPKLEAELKRLLKI